MTTRSASGSSRSSANACIAASRSSLLPSRSARARTSTRMGAGATRADSAIVDSIALPAVIRSRSDSVHPANASVRSTIRARPDRRPTRLGAAHPPSAPSRTITGQPVARPAAAPPTASNDRNASRSIRVAQPAKIVDRREDSASGRKAIRIRKTPSPIAAPHSAPVNAFIGSPTGPANPDPGRRRAAGPASRGAPDAAEHPSRQRLQ